MEALIRFLLLFILYGIPVTLVLALVGMVAGVVMSIGEKR